jgi:pimeloyl-ACP methyl ester carboxylesterase
MSTAGAQEGQMEQASIYKSEETRAEIEALYDRARDRLPFPTESRTVDTTFGSTHVLVAGPVDGQPLFVLQGGNVVNPITLAWLAPLVDTCRIYAPDTIGQPGKSAGKAVSGNDSSLGEWCGQVLDGLGLDAPAFVAISYGAGVLLRLAALRPARIGSAVLVVPAGISDVPVGSMIALAAGYVGYLAIRRPGLVRATVRRLAGPDPDPLVVESTELAFRGTKLDTEMPRNATAAELAGLTAPVMVLAGEHDPLFPPGRVLPRAREVFPNLVAAETLAGCRHILDQTCVAYLGERVRAFLTGPIG